MSRGCFLRDNQCRCQRSPADIACVLKGGCIITEHSVFSRPVTAITDGCIIGYKYFDFGSDNSSKTMEFSAKVRGCGCRAIMTVMIDGTDNGIVLGECEIGASDGIYNAIHALNEKLTASIPYISE